MTTRDRWTFERELLEEGVSRVAGVDEAGRGPLAGPVAAAAVILPTDFRHDGIRDSKTLTASRRERLAAVIRKEALCCSVALSSVEEIEALNILGATRRAMKRAVDDLFLRPQYLLVDAVALPDIDIPQRPIVKGDDLSVSIAAASILAKVERDGIMAELHRLYPQYGFDRHKGYGTARHREAIERHGPCPAHRASFRGVREHLPEDRTGG